MTKRSSLLEVYQGKVSVFCDNSYMLTSGRASKSLSWASRILRLITVCTLVSYLRCAQGQTSYSTISCPDQELIVPCRCLNRGEEFQIWCSHSELPLVLSGLKAIGQLLKRPIDELILENNNLPSLPGRFFVQLRVMRLMLRNNNLERVSSGWLSGLEDSLMELYIVEPGLRSLPVDSLQHLETLEAVTIKSGYMKRVPNFSGLPRLNYIQVESLSLMELSPRSLKHLPSLEKLHITGSDRFERLESDVITDLPRLSLINISYTGLNWIHPRALAMLPSLIDLQLIGNRLTDAGMVGRSLLDLPALASLKLEHNYIEKLHEASFVDLPALKSLCISHNKIIEIHHGAFHRIPMLRRLELNHNFIERVHPESFLQHSGSGLEELWLVNNNINHINELRSILDTLPRLIFLDMSHNFLEEIPFGALRGHATLERLHLDHNKIQLVEREAFMAMPALRELRLRNNSLSNLLEGPLWNLPALKGLDLSENYFRRIEPRLLTNLPSLRKIDLSKNEIQMIDPATFLETPQLEFINISHNVLSSLHPATFRHLMNLYELDVSNNRLIEFVPGLPRGIEYLIMAKNQITNVPMSPSPDLDLPSLRMLDISNNGINRLPPGSMRSLPQLKRLHIAKNSLQHLEDGCFEGLSRLEILDLHGNRLLILHPKCFRNKRELLELNLKNNRLEMFRSELLQDTPRLRKLDLSKNIIPELMLGTFDNTRELRHLDVSYNALSELPNAIRGLQNLQILDLTNNRLKTLQPETLSSLNSLSELKISKNDIKELRQGAFHKLQHLKELDLRENDLEYMEMNAVYDLPSLKSIKLGKNRLKVLNDGVFNELPSLQIAELQENQLINIGNNAFLNVPHLLFLNLSHNQLSGLEEAGLRNLRSLEVLDVSFNRVSRIDSSSLSKMEWLVELRLDNNKICTIQGTPFNGMPRLRVLSLRNNRMTSLLEQAVKRLRSSISVLDVEGNPITCSCQMIWMRAWLRESSELGPRCSDGSFLRDMRLTRNDCYAQNGRTTNELKREALVPGCETEFLDSNQHSAAQIYTPWMQIKNPNLNELNRNTALMGLKDNTVSVAPSPEESEYFYDDYVDYPFNESSLAVEFQNSTNQPGLNSSSEKLSSHYITGDTPTLYAEPRKNSTVNNSNEQKGSSSHLTPSTSGFTFFGMPLPALNLNSFWGRNADKRNGVVRTRGTSGRVQMFPLNKPDIQNGGFVPMLPGSGGFKPIPNPQINNKNDHKLEGTFNPQSIDKGYNISYDQRRIQYNHSRWQNQSPSESTPIIKSWPTGDVIKRGPALNEDKISLSANDDPASSSSEEIPDHRTKYSISKTESKVIHSSTTTINPGRIDRVVTIKNAREEDTTDVLKTPSSSTAIPSSTSFIFAETSTISESNIEVDPNNISLDDFIDITGPEKERLENLSDNAEYAFTTQENVINNGQQTYLPIRQENIYERQQADFPVRQESLRNISESSLIGSKPVDDLWNALATSKQKTENAKNETPSPLSALLVPGGQQPQYRPPIIGRPTITKIESLNLNTTTSLPINTEKSLAEQENSYREPKTQFENDATTIRAPSYDSSMSWYFMNYNQSNLEPYIGPGADMITINIGTTLCSNKLVLIIVTVFNAFYGPKLHFT